MELIWEYSIQKTWPIKIKRTSRLNRKTRFTDIQVKIMPYNQYFYAPKMNKIVVVKSEWVLKNEN